MLAIIGPHFAKRKETVNKTQMDGILVLVYKTAAQRTATHYSSTDLNKANYLMAFCALEGSPHLPVTLAKLMRPSIG